jgi:formamidopyrimidine-DNA glycosylase
MPELPEVEFAVKRLRRALKDRTITSLRALHPSQKRALAPAVTRRVRGKAVRSVERRGKHQLIHLEDDATLLVHFRLNGDWEVGRADEAPPRFARVVIDLDDGKRVSLVDSRALCTVKWYAPGVDPDLGLGPDPEDPAVTPESLRAGLARKRGPVKPALLDQRLLAGVGNIYAAEACWHAAIDPRTPASKLSAARVRKLLSGLRRALADGHTNAGRYHQGEREVPFKVYDRAGEPCRRCRKPIKRITQAGRSTYYCPGCQT